MKVPKLGDDFYWKGKPAKIHSMADRPTVVIKTEETVCCPHCRLDHKRDHYLSVIPTSPLFQENAEPIQTLDIL